MSIDPEFSVDTARSAAARDALGEWVTDFLASPGSDNAELAELLAGRIKGWLGPVRVPLDRLHRLAGPPDAPVLCPVDEDYWDDRVDDIAERIESGAEPPPVIVTFRDDHLALEDGNHRVEGLRQAGRDHAWAVIGFETAAAREHFDMERTSVLRRDTHAERAEASGFGREGGVE